MHSIVHYLNTYGLYAMFFIILLEYACFPISSEIVLPLSGAIALTQHVSFLFVLLLSLIAGLIGTSICYLIGKIGGSRLLSFLSRRHDKIQKGIDFSYKKFDQYGTSAVLFGRMIPLCRTYIAFVAGATKQSYLRFLGASAIGIFLWNTLLIGFGYIFGSNWGKITYYYQRYRQFLLPFLLCLLLILLFRHRNKNQKQITH